MLQMINQPYNGQLGTILKDKLANGKYKHFVIVSAFAKNSGVLRMKSDIQSFRNRGGKVDAFIGLDAQGTSYEAVCNLFQIVDNLYLVHDNNPVVTFHSKIYYLTDSKSSHWIAIGSNNLTGGGLWTNYESATVVDTEPFTNIDIISVNDEIIKLIKTYKNPESKVSLRIKDVREIKGLVRLGLLRNEIDLQIETAQSRQKESMHKFYRQTGPFGTQGPAYIPRVKTQKDGNKIVIDNREDRVASIEPIEPSDNPEKMWFETRAMTGGSRNILDLSMLGRLIMGTGKGTRYETDNPSFVLGSVVFFDIDPTNDTVEKDVTINYNATDYVGCTIKMHQGGKRPNGSWRIQLKGESASGIRLTSAKAENWLVHKIIILEKIHSDYYSMSVLPETEYNNLRTHSIFVARNGSGSSSKCFGLLNI